MKTGIEIETSFLPLVPLSWGLFLVKPVVEINDKKNKNSWGLHFYDLPAGEHLIKIYFSYMGHSKCGANQINVKVEEGKTTKITYKMPPWMFKKGAIKEV
ncbi:MAG: hypothetical protein RBS19_10620 [Bacteroidales bacterium]|nr:hypothetical protein [Bacteroidales bacterium]